MEYCSGGNLYDAINAGQMTERSARPIINGVLSGLACIHSWNFIHRDLKPAKILLQKGKAKICDFGLAIDTGESSYHHVDYRGGTVFYQAPEQAECIAYSKPVDIWATGLLMLECITGEHLLEDYRNSERSDIKKAVLGLTQDDISFEAYSVSPLAKTLLEKLISISPKLRYKAHEALKHPWITGEDSAPIPVVFSQQLADEYDAMENFSRLQKFMMAVAFLKQNVRQVK